MAAGVPGLLSEKNVYSMQKLLYLLLLTLSVGTLSAYASRPLKRSVVRKQSDGTTLRVTKQGDALHSVYVTSDGLALLPGTDGSLCYAAWQGDALQPSDRLAHEAGERTAAEAAFVAQQGQLAVSALARLRAAEPAGRQCAPQQIEGVDDGLGSYGTYPTLRGTVRSIGAPVIPVIMASFADRDFQEGFTAEKLDRWLNEEGYADEPYCKGSVADYYRQNSGGLFEPRFEVVARVQVANGYAYYGKNSGGVHDVKGHAFVREAIDCAIAAGADFAPYVDEASGGVPLVSVCYAGPGEQSAFEAGCEDYIWAAYSSVLNYTAGGVKFNSFFYGNELFQSYAYDENDNLQVTGSQPDGIGVFVHEFGHALGFPDFYYTGADAFIKNSLFTMDYWSMMDYGEYAYDGYAPVGLNAYERSYLGWLKVEELTEAGSYRLYPFGRGDEGATAYVVRSADSEKEYYLLENRQPDTWYYSIFGHGMLVTHVNYDATAWRNNYVNNTVDNQRFEYIPADATKQGPEDQDNKFAGYKGDLYPGTSGVHSLTDDSTPSATVSTGKLGKPLYNIQESADGVISFDFLTDLSTGIDAVEAPAGADTYYSIDGRRLGKAPESGVYLLRRGGKTIKQLK